MFKLTAYWIVPNICRSQLREILSTFQPQVREVTLLFSDDSVPNVPTPSSTVCPAGLRPIQNYFDSPQEILRLTERTPSPRFNKMELTQEYMDASRKPSCMIERTLGPISESSETSSPDSKTQVRTVSSTSGTRKELFRVWQDETIGAENIS